MFDELQLLYCLSLFEISKERISTVKTMYKLLSSRAARHEFNSMGDCIYDYIC